MLLPAEATPRMFLLAIFLSIIAVAICSVQAIHVALFSLLWIGLPFVFPALRIYPLTLLVPLVIYGMIITAVPSLRRSVAAFRAFRSRRFNFSFSYDCPLRRGFDWLVLSG
jgi:hypothetical protein